MEVETTNIIFNVASRRHDRYRRQRRSLGVSVDGAERGPSQDSGSFLHSRSSRSTNIIFNVANGGAIDIGGNVEAFGDQSLFGASPH